MAWGKNKKKGKKAKVNVVPRPKPVPPKPVKAGAPAEKPVDGKLLPISAAKIPGHGKPKGGDPKVNIHMLGNAMVCGIQYKAGTDIQVPASVFRAIGKSCVTQNTWKAIKAKSGLKSLHK